MLDRLALWSVIAIGVVWLAYPAVMAALAAMVRLFSPRRDPDPGTPARVTVVVASREPVSALRDRIRNLQETDLPPGTIELVVGVHFERFDEIESAFASLAPGVRIVAATAKGKPAALNAAVAAATGEVIVFADTYQRFDADTIPKLLRRFADARVGAVSGRLELAPGTPALVSLYWAIERSLRNAEAVVHSSIGVTGAVYAMRRQLWHALPEQLLLDDVFGPMRLILDGHRIAFEPDALAHEVRSIEPGHEYRRKVRTLTGVIQLCSWMPAVLVPFRNPVWLQFVFHKLLRLLTPWWLLIIAIGLLARSTALPGVIAWSLLLVAGPALIWLIRTRQPFGARLRSVATQGILLQAATIVASFNGLRGKWQVWD